MNRRNIPVQKLVAAGNDFVFVMAGRDVPEGWAPSENQVRAICDRHFGVGADGFVIMKKLDEAKYEWSFFNSDGSFAAMCGNAARAAACFLGEANWPVELVTGFGAVKLEALTSNEFRVQIDYSVKRLRPTPIEAAPTGLDFLVGQPVLIDTGVPHVVIETTNKELSFQTGSMERALAPPFRWPKEAGPAGANVTVFRRTGTATIDAVTFERGVEDYTLSCGTGVLAAAVIASNAFRTSDAFGASDAVTSGKWAREIEVRNPGGLLKVDSKDFPNSLMLTGPARLVFRTELEHDFGI